MTNDNILPNLFPSSPNSDLIHRSEQVSFLHASLDKLSKVNVFSLNL